MANEFLRRPIVGGDVNTWGVLEEAQNKAVLSQYTSYLYNDSGSLKINQGHVGVNDGTNFGVAVIDTVTTISIAGVSSSNWAYIYLSVSGTTVTFSVADIVGETDPDAFPSSTIDALWNGVRGGYYNGSNRIIGAIYKNASAALSIIYNTAKQFSNNEFIQGPKYSIFNSNTNQTPGSGWNTLTLDATLRNEINGVSISSNQITLPIGKYEIRAYSYFNISGSADPNGIRIRDVTNGATLIVGTGITTGLLGGDDMSVLFIADGVVTIESAIDIELQSYLTLAGDTSTGWAGAETDIRRIMIKKVG